MEQRVTVGCHLWIKLDSLIRPIEGMTTSSQLVQLLEMHNSQLFGSREMRS